MLGSSKNRMINLINYHLKYLVYCCKSRGTQPLLSNFVTTLTNVHKVERQLACKNNNVDVFN